MSDCHRGIGDHRDNFSKNQNIYFHALMHYYNKGYTYIELGDGDELWENRKFDDIKRAHSDVFWLLSKFYKDNRFYSLYGNHDVVKKKAKYVSDNLYSYYDEREKKYLPLFEKIKIYEAIVLRYRVTGDNILLIHGHQGDFINDRLWHLTRLMVRYLWGPLESLGVNDPTSPAGNYTKKEKVHGKLLKWAEKENKMIIAGHTHKPVFMDENEPLYFNDGSCVHPRCITAIEITNGEIMLIKWCVHARNNGTLFVNKEILAGPIAIKNYFISAEEKIVNYINEIKNNLHDI